MDPTNRNTALASAFVEELARSGLTRAVISPGSRSTPLALALWRQSEIECTVVVDERSAAFLAAGIAAASRSPVALCCTSGTAAANYLPAVAEADLSDLPLVVLTNDRPPELRDNGSGQTIDQIGIYGSAVRWFCEAGCHDADDNGLLFMRTTACRAVAAANGDPRPGPAHVNLSWRDPLGPEPVAGDVTATSPLALDGRDSSPLLHLRTPPPGFDNDLPAALAALIGDSARGLVVVGRQADAAIAGPVAELATLAGYPVLAEPLSQLRFNRDIDALAGYDLVARAAPAALAPGFVLRIGEMPTSKPLRQWLSRLEDCVQVVVDPSFGFNEPSAKASMVLRTDPALLIPSVVEALRGPAGGGTGHDPGWLDLWRAADTAAMASASAELDSTAVLSEPDIFRELAGQLTGGDALFLSSSMPVRDAETFMSASDADVKVWSNRGANGIDGVVASAAGFATASGHRTFAVIGEIAFQHDIGSLAVVADTNPDLRIIVINNGGGGIFSLLPQATQLATEEFETLMATPSPLDIDAACRAFSIPYRKANDAVSFIDAVIAEPGPRVIEAVPGTNRSGNADLHRRIGDRASAAVNAAVA